MKKKTAFLSAALAACMVFGSIPAPAWTPVTLEAMAAEAKAAVADGQIDESVEGEQTVRYFTGTDTEVTSAQTKNDRLSDFFYGTNSMKWSVEFKTSASGLRCLLGLNTSGQYYVLYVKNGQVSFEVKGTQTISSQDTTYADGQWHTATVEIKKNGKTKLTVDDKEVSADTKSGTCIGDWEPTAFTIGGLTGYGTTAQNDGWKYSGSMRNIVLTKEVAANFTPVYEVANPAAGKMQTQVAALTTGTLHVTYRQKEEGTAKTELLTLADGSIFYVDPAAKKAGLQTKSGEKKEFTVNNTAFGTTKWHTLSLSLDGGNLGLTVDGTSAGSVSYDGKLDVSALTFAENIYCSTASVYDKALGEEQMADLHSTTSTSTYPDVKAKLEGYNKTENREIFNSGYDGSVAYRIPAIVTSKKTGTVIASIDKRWNHSGDVGKIDSVIRRSEDNGKTWSNIIPVIDMPDADAYTVDPALAVDNQEDSPYYGRIYMIVDMYPYNIGLWGSKPGSGYKEIDGVKYRCLYDSSSREYTVRENGYVYDSEGQLTEYQVETDADAPYTELGSLYKSGKKIGSIYKNSELKIYETTYLWVSYSDDDGKTWSQPKDITPMVKADWMCFSGTGPGQGLQLQNGRIVFSAYSSHEAKSSALASFHVYTDDGGETWHRGASPNDKSETENSSNSTRELNENSIVQLNNGHMIQFMKNPASEVAMAISEDNGATWSDITYAKGIPEVYCNLSALHYPEKIVDPRDGKAKEAIIFANPAGPGRTHGTVRIAFVNEDDTLDWAYSKLIEENRFAYCSLTVMENGDIGMIYEHEGYAMIGAAFTSFSPEYIMDGNVYENTPAPTKIETKLTADGEVTDVIKAGTTITADVTFSQNVFAAGDVALNVRVGENEREAKLVGNVETNKLRFAYTLTEEDEGKVVVTGEVKVKDGGAAETVYNVKLSENPITLKDVTLGKVEQAAQAGAFAELPTTGMTATAGSAYGGTNEGPAANVLDGDLTTHWHTKYDDDNADRGGRDKHWITIALGGERMVNALEYTPRTGGTNGTITEYQIEVSTDGTNFTPIARGNWQKTSDVKMAEFGGAVKATHVKLRAIDTGDNWATAGEIRLIGTKDMNGISDKTELLAALVGNEDYAENKEFTDLAEAAKTAMSTAQNQAASEADVKAAKDALASAIEQAAKTAQENLSKLIQAEAGKEKDNYNISSWAAYQEALKTAKDLDANSDSEAVLKAYSILAEAEKNLRFRSNSSTAAKAELKQEMDALLGLKEADYTAESWKVYEDAYKKAEVVYADADASVDEIRAAINELKAAKDALKIKEETPDTKPETPDTKPDGKPELKPTPDTKPNPTPGVKPNPTPDVKPTLVQGSVYESAKLKYKVTDLQNKTVALVGAADAKTRKNLTVKNTVKLEGVTFKVTEVSASAFKNCKKLTKVVIGKNVISIGKQAFAGCAKLKNINIKTKKLNSVGAKAWKGISKKAVIKVPKAKKTLYKKKLAKKGQPKSVKIK